MRDGIVGKHDLTPSPSLPPFSQRLSFSSPSYLRFVNLVTSVVTCVMAALMFLGSITTGGNAQQVVMCFYVFSFGIMICCFELQLKAVAQVRDYGDLEGERRVNSTKIYYYYNS